MQKKANSDKTTELKLDRWYTVDEIAKQTGLSPWVLRGMIARGELRAHRVGRRKLIIHGSDALALPYLQARARTGGDLLTPAQAAEVLGVARSTLARWRSAGTGPTVVRAGRAVWYPKETLLDFAKVGGHAGA